MIVRVTEDYKGETYQAAVDEKRSSVLLPIITGDYTRTFDVEFDRRADTLYDKAWLAVRAYLFGFDMPRPFSTLRNDPWTYVYRYSVEPPTGALHRRVIVHYKTFVDPTTIPPEKRLYFKSSTDILDYAPALYSAEPISGIEDIEHNGIDLGMALTNSSGEPLDPAVVKEYKDLILSFQFWRQYDFEQIAQFKAKFIDSVNYHSFFGFPPGFVRVDTIEAEEQQIALYRYWLITMEFAVRYKKSDPLRIGWLRRFLDQGFRTLVRTDGVVTGTEQITDDEDKPISRPRKLDGHGNLLAEGAMPVFLYVRDFEYEDFDQLNLS